MTALHMLASMKPEDVIIDQFTMLIDCGADVDLRAFPPNEAEDRKKLLLDRDMEVIGNVELGQAPLHMVCLREDTDSYAIIVSYIFLFKRGTVFKAFTIRRLLID